MLTNVCASPQQTDVLQEILRSVNDDVVVLVGTETVIGSGTVPGHIRLSNTIRETHPDILLLNIGDSCVNTVLELCQAVRKTFHQLYILIIAEDGDPCLILTLLQNGVTDFILPPFTTSNILPRLLRLKGEASDEDSPIGLLREQLGLCQMIGRDPAFLSELQKIPLVAKTDVQVLVSGETGTGKELVVRAIHNLSQRKSKPFVPVNCGAIPPELAENELFGHERGAFTGADSWHVGLITEAEGGTVFLDEVDCLTLAVQSKLLRFIQEREYRPLGFSKTRKADVRVIAATNTNLHEAVENGRFRRDLYYRLNVVPIVLPALRDRVGDILVLGRHFLKQFSVEFDKNIREFSCDAAEKLVTHDWAGNVRELENVIERAVLFSTGPIIRGCDLNLGTGRSLSYETFQQAKSRAVSHFERRYIHSLLLANQGNISRAARAAQKHRRAFWGLMRKHGIEVKKCS